MVVNLDEVGCPTSCQYRQGDNCIYNFEKPCPTMATYLKKIRLKPQLELIEQIDEVSEPVYLDLGEVDGGWYYGTSIDKHDAIITNDFKIYRNTVEPLKSKEGVVFVGDDEIKEFGLNYEGHIGTIAPRWSKESIRAFFEGKKVEKRDIFEAIKGKIDYFIDFNVEGTENAPTVQACWIIATYCYPLFYWFANLLNCGPKESGKSKDAFIVTNLSFAGFDLGASAGVTTAQVYRTLEGNRGTILIDEYEQNPNSETQRLVNQILNAGVTRNSYVIRNEEIGKKWIATKFSIFCPKIVCNITGINPTSLSRFIPFNLLKTLGEKAKRKPWHKSEIEQFKPIRDDCHILIMQHWKEIKEIYESLELNLSGREEDNWRPICTIAKWLGDDVLEKVLDYIKKHQEIIIETSDLEEDLFRHLLLNVDELLRLYSCKEIARWIGEELAQYKSPSNWVGRVLTKYKFKRDHKEFGRGYYLSKQLIQNIIDRYFTNIPSDSSDNSSSSVSSDNSAKDCSEVSELSEPSTESEEDIEIEKIE